MPFKFFVNKSNKNLRRICLYCKKDLHDESRVILECGHEEHIDCLKKRMLHNLYNSFWDNWGLYDHHCLHPKCCGKIKHICKVYDYRKKDCISCLDCTYEPDNPEETDRLNQTCVNHVIIGYIYKGDETKGNIVFVKNK
jgi:hypothetical protein